MKKRRQIRAVVPKPRNPLVAWLRRAGAGVHRSVRRERPREQKDLLQRLREAGL